MRSTWACARCNATGTRRARGWRRIWPSYEAPAMKDKLDFLVPGGGLRGPLLADLADELDAADSGGKAEAANADGRRAERVAADAARVGEQIEPFKLVSLLGTGGMGTVYLAERTEGNFLQQVALKLVRGGLARPAEPGRF